jgi:hypothetical protein
MLPDVKTSGRFMKQNPGAITIPFRQGFLSQFFQQRSLFGPFRTPGIPILNARHDSSNPVKVYAGI